MGGKREIITLEELERRVGNGDAVACYQRGLLRLKGKIIKRDFALAKQDFESAIKTKPDHEGARIELARLLIEGRRDKKGQAIVARNFDRAAKLLLPLVAKKNPEATHLLGDYYLHAHASKWWRRAVEYTRAAKETAKKQKRDEIQVVRADRKAGRKSAIARLLGRNRGPS